MWYFGICYVEIWHEDTIFSKENTIYVFYPIIETVISSQTLTSPYQNM
jgi:hypothetical protein